MSKMVGKYDNGVDNFSDTNSADFKRRTASAEVSHELDVHDEANAAASAKANQYIEELLNEKSSLDSNSHPHSIRLLTEEITTARETGRPIKEEKYVDIYRDKPIRVCVKVSVPAREYPRFNFVGKILGPKGNSLKRLQQETMCKIAVLGRGSMRDKAKEDQLRASGDTKFLHLNEDLHLEISTIGTPAEAHARVAYALAEVRQYLIPDNNDIIRQEQMRELEVISGGVPIKEGKTTVVHPVGAYPPGHPSLKRPGVVPASHAVPPGVIVKRPRTAVDDVAYHPAPGAIIYEDPHYHSPSPSGVIPGRHASERGYVEYAGPVSSSAFASSRHYEEYEPEYYPSSSRHRVEVVDPYAHAESSRAWKSYKTTSTSSVAGSSSSSRHESSASSSRYRTSPYRRSK